MERLNDNRCPRQLSLRRDDEVQVLKMHARAQDPGDVVSSHPRPGIDVETRKRPLPSTPTVDVSSKHQRVNLCYYALGPDGVLKDTRFILARVECPYLQFVAAARVINTEKFIVGLTNGRERDRSRVSDAKVKWALRAWLLLSRV